MREASKEDLTLSEISAELDRTVAIGGVAVERVSLGNFEMAAIQATGETDLFAYEIHDKSDEAFSIRGLRLVGAMRRKGLLKLRRGFVECTPSELKPGDKIVLEDDQDGDRLTAFKVEVIDSNDQPGGSHAPGFGSFQRTNAVVGGIVAGRSV